MLFAASTAFPVVCQSFKLVSQHVMYNDVYIKFRIRHPWLQTHFYMSATADLVCCDGGRVHNDYMAWSEILYSSIHLLSRAVYLKHKPPGGHCITTATHANWIEIWCLTFQHKECLKLTRPLLIFFCFLILCWHYSKFSKQWEKCKTVDFWVSFPTRQALTLWGGVRLDLQSQCVILWRVGTPKASVFDGNETLLKVESQPIKYWCFGRVGWDSWHTKASVFNGLGARVNNPLSYT